MKFYGHQEHETKLTCIDRSEQLPTFIDYAYPSGPYYLTKYLR